jgi:uncharacterized membrane protein
MNENIMDLDLDIISQENDSTELQLLRQERDFFVSERLASLKRVAGIVYFCQLFSFVLAGLPLVIGVWLNLLKRDDAKSTWIKSHFDWQIKTAWLALAGFAISGLTFEMGMGFFVLIATITLMVFRIVRGWNALNVNEPITE